MVQAGCFESAEFRNFRALPRSEQLAWQKRHHEKYASRLKNIAKRKIVYPCAEFYAALIPTVLYYHNTVFVGRTKVTVTPKAIIDYLQVPIDSDVEYREGFVDREPLKGIHGELAASLRRDGDDRWIPGTNDLKYSSLYVDLAVWTLFIKSNIIPSKHRTVHSPDTARCLYSIKHDLPLHRGFIIHRQILVADMAVKGKTGILPFPCLITHLCRAAGTRIPAGGPTLTPPTGDIGKKMYNIFAANHDPGSCLPGYVRKQPQRHDDDDADDDDEDMGDTAIVPTSSPVLPLQIHPTRCPHWSTRDRVQRLPTFRPALQQTPFR
ncbi:hypothetical protein L2E82_39377 [Cichorium intybus]|uniref:Uncharacterized protein n=1 Tax=Cichorium intybus TaxID=13427 RepID=A0ACB9AI15_CICIN|nr:hypothetical protein L2E82_39377 [Cichorium intybus]